MEGAFKSRSPDILRARGEGASVPQRGWLHLLGGRAAGAAARLARLVATYWSVLHRSDAASGLHAELSRLSDAELARRGLARDHVSTLVFEKLTIAQDVSAHSRGSASRVLTVSAVLKAAMAFPGSPPYCRGRRP